MTPDAAIAALDKAVQIAGQDIILRRTTGTALIKFDSPTTRARVVDYRPDELVGEVQQGDRKAILSPTMLANWPAPPTKGDRVVVDGAVWAVMNVNPLSIGNRLVRIEMQIRG